VEVGLALGRALGHMPVRLKALLRVLSRNNLDIWLIITLVGWWLVTILRRSAPRLFAPSHLLASILGRRLVLRWDGLLDNHLIILFYLVLLWDRTHRWRCFALGAPTSTLFNAQIRVVIMVRRVGLGWTYFLIPPCLDRRLFLCYQLRPQHELVLHVLLGRLRYCLRAAGTASESFMELFYPFFGILERCLALWTCSESFLVVWAFVRALVRAGLFWGWTFHDATQLNLEWISAAWLLFDFLNIWR
jgi:hypothetical protein